MSYLPCYTRENTKYTSQSALMSYRQCFHTVGFFGGDILTWNCTTELQLSPPSVILSSNETQNGDTLVPANPGTPGKWPLGRKERESLHWCLFHCTATFNACIAYDIWTISVLNIGQKCIAICADTGYYTNTFRRSLTNGSFSMTTILKTLRNLCLMKNAVHRPTSPPPIMAMSTSLGTIWSCRWSFQPLLSGT